MQCNVGPNERYVRIALGLASGVAAASLQGSSGWRLPLAVVAVAELATAATRYCPVSALLGIDNCKGEKVRHRLERLPDRVRAR